MCLFKAAESQVKQTSSVPLGVPVNTLYLGWNAAVVSVLVTAVTCQHICCVNSQPPLGCDGRLQVWVMCSTVTHIKPRWYFKSARGVRVGCFQKPRVLWHSRFLQIPESDSRLSQPWLLSASPSSPPPPGAPLLPANSPTTLENTLPSISPSGTNNTRPESEAVLALTKSCFLIIKLFLCFFC